MLHWYKDFEKGKMFLSQHNPEKAIKFFEKAVKECPVKNKGELSDVLFYLGIALKKLGFPNCAVKSWNIGKKSKKKSKSGKMIEQFSNDYGMVKQKTGKLDDWKAFYAIHLNSYLNSRPSRKIESDAEKDAVEDQIYLYWTKIISNEGFYKKRPEEKLVIFRTAKIFYNIESPLTNKVISVDLLRKTEITDDSRCSCNSGMPFLKCCGRIKGEDECLFGLF